MLILLLMMTAHIQARTSSDENQGNFQLSLESKNGSDLTFNIQDKTNTMHFREIGSVAFTEDHVFMSFDYQLRPLLEKAYTLAFRLNQTHLMTRMNEYLAPFINPTETMALQARDLYHHLKETLRVWEAHDLQELVELEDFNWRMAADKAAYTIPHFNQIQMPAGSQIINDRGKRQVLAAIAGAGLTYVADQIGLLDLLGLKSDSSEKLHAAMGAVNTRFAADEEKMKNLAFEFKSLLSLEDKAFKQDQFAIMVQNLQTHLDDTRMEVNAAIRGLTELLHQNLSPDLVPYEFIDAGFKRIQKELQNSNRQPIHNNFVDLLALPVNHVLNHTSLEIFVVLAIPITSDFKRQKLYQYIDFPAYIGGTQNYIFPRPAYEFIAVNQLATTYKELKAGDLLMCKREGTLFICPDLAIQIQAEDTCLTALYKGKGAEIVRHCAFTQVMRDYVLQLSNTQFQLYHKDEREVSLSCTNSTQRKSFRFIGTKRITMPVGCELDTGKFTLSSKRQLHGSKIEITQRDLPPLPVNNDTMSVTALAELERMVNKTNFLDNEKIKSAADQFQEVLAYNHWHWISLVLVSIISGMAVFIFCTYCKGKTKKRINEYAVTFSHLLGREQQTETRELEPVAGPSETPETRTPRPQEEQLREDYFHFLCKSAPLETIILWLDLNRDYVDRYCRFNPADQIRVRGDLDALRPSPSAPKVLNNRT